MVLSVVCRALRKNVFGTGIRIGRAQILRTEEKVRAYTTKLGEIELYLERQRELVRLRYEVHLIEDGMPLLIQDLKISKRIYWSCQIWLYRQLKMMHGRVWLIVL